MIYGYCRISTKKQSIDRQIRNIKSKYENAKIITETHTGTNLDRRKEFQSLIKKVEEGDIIVFDSVSRFSRDAVDGFNLYKELLDKGVQLEFLKEPYINTSVYLEQLNNNSNIKVQDLDLDKTLIEGLRNYLLILIEKQIKIAFEQAEKEVKDLQQRTKEGLITARSNGKVLGRPKNSLIVTKKSKETKEKILELSKNFNGSLSDKDVLKYLDVSRKTYYKYKKELSNSLT